MRASSRYVKIVEWSEEDQCFVGSCPGLFYAGCHGKDERGVFAELCEIVDETIASTSRTANRSPKPPAGRTTPTSCCMSADRNRPVVGTICLRCDRRRSAYQTRC